MPMMSYPCNMLMNAMLDLPGLVLATLAVISMEMMGFPDLLFAIVVVLTISGKCFS